MDIKMRKSVSFRRSSESDRYWNYIIRRTEVYKTDTYYAVIFEDNRSMLDPFPSRCRYSICGRQDKISIDRQAL